MVKSFEAAEVRNNQKEEKVVKGNIMKWWFG